MSIRYRLDELGWIQFEWLCQSLLQKDYGVAIEAWGGSGDHGRDAYCRTTLRFPCKDTSQEGPFVFQAKFIENANAAGAKPAPLLKSAVHAECVQIANRIKKGDWPELPKLYCILTNSPVSASLREQLPQEAKAILPDTKFHVLDANDMCSMLDNAPAIRGAFPQLLGLSDLNQLIANVFNKDILERSTLAIEEAQELASVFVQTASYNHALSCLSRNHFVMLSGPPEMGKTAIARMIGLAKLGEGWECYECTSPKDIFEIYNKDQSQIFIADDAFGSTEYRADRAQQWADGLQSILRLLSKSNHRLIFTSRTAPLNAALEKMHLQGLSENFPNPANVIVDASYLSTHEKARILFWHAKFKKLERLQKMILLHYHSDIIENKHFTPLRISNLITKLFLICQETNYDGSPPKRHFSDAFVPMPTANPLQIAIRHELEEPTSAMRKSFNNLTNEEKSFLIAMLDVGNPILQDELFASFLRHNCGDESTSPEDVQNRLLGHFLQINKKSLSGVYEWVHPTWRDLVIQTLNKTVSLRQRFLAKTTINGIILALSTAGGGDGKTNLPLLLDGIDWDLLSEASIKIMNSVNEDEQKILLNSLQALQSYCEKNSLGNERIHFVQDFIQKILNAYYQTWNSSPDPIPLDSLQLFTSLSITVSPLPASPDLRRTWSHHWGEAERSLMNQETDNYDLEKIQDWLSLARIIEDLEPRFLQQQKWPHLCTSAVNTFLALDLEHDLEAACIDDEVEFDNELDRLNLFTEVLSSLASFFSCISDEAYSFMTQIEERLDFLREECGRLFPEPEYDNDDYRPVGCSTSMNFDIGQMFTDYAHE